MPAAKNREWIAAKKPSKSSIVHTRRTANSAMTPPPRSKARADDARGELAQRHHEAERGEHRASEQRGHQALDDAVHVVEVVEAHRA